MRRYGAKRDRSEAAVVQALRTAGWSVLYVSAPSLPDLWVYRHQPTWVGHWVEVKTGKSKLRETQQWDFPVIVMRDPADIAQLEG